MEHNIMFKEQEPISLYIDDSQMDERLAYGVQSLLLLLS